MKYDERINVIKKWFKESITTRFSLPSGIEPAIVFNDTVEAVNSQVPSSITLDKINIIIASVTKDISRSAKSRTLPIVKEFVDATKIASSRLSAATQGPPVTSYDHDTYRLAEARIRKGERISELFLRGTMRERLLETTSITAKDLEPYEKYLAYAAHKQ